MKKLAFLCLCNLFVLVTCAHGQKLLTGKEIYGANCPAVVQIYIGRNFSGVGFLISPDGVIATANHVVTTRESNFRQYATPIQVQIFGNPYPFGAEPLTAISDDQVNYDSALIKVTAPTQLPHVSIGDWKEADVSDHVTIVPSWPGIGCMALDGTVTSSVVAQSPLGPKPMNTIIFQAPVRNGFSGSPIFSSKGHVIAIVDTKVFGISVSLDEQRKKWMATQTNVRMSFAGIDVASSFLDLINNLDQNLISGLGSAVDISYAKQMSEAARKKD